VKGKEERQSNFFDVCSKCKTNYDCCHGTRPPITRERKRIIEEYLKREKIPISDAFAEEYYVFPRENKEGYCIFHDMNIRKCRIHPVKPETCVAGPITFDINKKTGKIEWHLKKEKICSLAGKMFKNEKALRKHLESAKTEIIRLVHQLDPKALQIILKIDEPHTFKVGEDNIDKEILDKLTCDS
jgi:Fe-S-cluster containining protein